MPKLGGSTLHVILPYICESSKILSEPVPLLSQTCPARGKGYGKFKSDTLKNPFRVY